MKTLNKKRKIESSDNERACKRRKIDAEAYELIYRESLKVGPIFICNTELDLGRPSDEEMLLVCEITMKMLSQRKEKVVESLKTRDGERGEVMMKNDYNTEDLNEPDYELDCWI